MNYEALKRGNCHKIKLFKKIFNSYLDLRNFLPLVFNIRNNSS